MARDQGVRNLPKAWRLFFSGLGLAFCLFPPLPARAQDAASLDKQLKEISTQLKAQESRLVAQERLLKSQQEAIAKQSAVIENQRRALAQLHVQTETPTLQPVAVVMPLPQAPLQTAQADSGVTHRTVSAPTSPVGEAPAQERSPQVVQSLPEGLAVLTPARHFILAPSFGYTQTTNDRLVFRGVVIVPGINLGEVEASTDDRSIASSVLDLRYGITDRLEVEARVPFTFSDDRATVLTQGINGSATQSVYLSSTGIGDVEVAARYQINSGRDEWPIFVANARVKTDTGLGPFDVKRDAAGVAEQVALGSGFLGLEGGFSVLKLTDPAVLFGSVNYVYQVPKDINRTIGNVLVGRVEPGSSVNVNLGFGFAVNPDFSFSLGYEHGYVLPQYTMLGTTQQATTALQVGALMVGMAYRLGPTMSLNGNFEFGVTHDAPNMRAVFSLPMTF